MVGWQSRSHPRLAAADVAAAAAAAAVAAAAAPAPAGVATNLVRALNFLRLAGQSFLNWTE